MSMHPTKIPLPGPRKRRTYLREYGFKRSLKMVYRGELIIFAAFCAALLVFYLVEGPFADDIATPAGEAATTAAALGALLLGYQQWKEARHESSMEKYYERLDLPNRRTSAPVYSMMKEIPNGTDESEPARMMYVYLELDNLEYVIEKYKLGYMRPKQACRGLRTFQRRCLAPEFRKRARQRVQFGDYNPRTAYVVKKVCEMIDRLEEGKSKAEAPQAATPFRNVAPAPRPAERLLSARAGLWLALIPGLLFALGFRRI
jgi:hypothetical protein